MSDDPQGRIAGTVVGSREIDLPNGDTLDVYIIKFDRGGLGIYLADELEYEPQ